MNPKSVNDLDPKLKETYERVMGTSLSASPAAPPVVPKMETQPAVEAQPQPQPQIPAAPSVNQDANVSQVFRADNQGPALSETTVSSPSSDTATKKKSGGIKKLPLLIIGAVLFLVVYTVIWAKVLGLF